MKKLLLVLAFCLISTGAFAQCNGVFNANSVCGSINGGPPRQVPITSFTGIVTGPATSVVGDLALWNNITGTLLKDGGSGTVNGIYTWSSNQTLTNNQNGATSWSITNNSTGTAAGAVTIYSNSVNSASFGIASTGYTIVPLLQNSAFINAGTGTAGIVLNNVGANPTIFGASNAEIARFTGTGQFNIGTAVTPPAGTLLTVNSNAAACPNIAGAGETIQGLFCVVDGNVAALSVVSFANFAGYNLTRANGTAALPTHLNANDLIGVLDAHGYGATGYFGGTPQIRFIASQNWSDTAQGSQLSFYTTPNGATAVGNADEALRLSQDQSTTIFGPFYGGTTASATLTIASTSGAGTTDSILFKTGSQTTRGIINTVGKWAFGATAPASSNAPFVDINQNASNVVGRNNNNMLRLVNADGASTVMEFETFAAGGNTITASQAEGTLASPSNSNSGRNLWSLLGYSYSGGFQLSAGIQMATAEAGATGSGSLIKFLTTPLTTTAVAEAGRFTPAGGLNVGDTANTASGVINAKSGFSAAGNLGLTTVCTETVGNTLTFTLGILTTKGANCT